MTEMTRRPNWYPDEIYHYLSNLGYENKVSYQEVAFMLLREALLPYGFDCVHPNVAFPKDAVGTDRNKPYCKRCYARLEQVKTIGRLRGETLRQPEYRAIETFVDKRRKDNLRKAEADAEAKLNAEVDARVKKILEKAAKKGETRDEVDA